MASTQAREEGGLHNAARVGDVSTIHRLLNAEPQSVHDRDRHSRTPYPYGLHLAAWAGQVEAVRVLCECHADVGATAGDDMAAIHFACQKGHVEVARCLLTAGAQLNMRTRKGMTPLHYAVQGQHQDVAKLLILRGANLSAQSKAGKRPTDLTKDESFLATINQAAEERQALEKKRKEQKAAQSAANKAKFVNATMAEGDDHEEEEEARTTSIGPTLPPQPTDSGTSPIVSRQEQADNERVNAERVDADNERVDDTSRRPAKRTRLAGTVLLGHLLDDDE